jgi:hypothetical protein
MTAEGKDWVRLTDSPGADGLPSFSPDGRRIVYVSDRDGNHDLWIVDADGKNARRLTDAPGLDTMPAWSPDGKTIAFTSDRDGKQGIYLVDADGSDFRRLSPEGAFDAWPAWNRDGTRLVFQSMRDGDFEIYAMAPKPGAPAERLTRHAAADRNPRVLPLGQEIRAPASGAWRWKSTVEGHLTSGAGPNPQKYPFKFESVAELSKEELGALLKDGEVPAATASKIAAMFQQAGDRIEKASLSAKGGAVTGSIVVFHKDGPQGTRTMTFRLTGKVAADGIAWTVDGAAVEGTWDWGGGIAKLEGLAKATIVQEGPAAPVMPPGHR